MHACIIIPDYCHKKGVFLLHDYEINYLKTEQITEGISIDQSVCYVGSHIDAHAATLH